MKFVGKEPSKEDLSSPSSLVKFFIKANNSYATQYKSGGPVHYPGRNRSVTELVKYCKQFGFTRSQVLPEIPKFGGIIHCGDINKYVIVTRKNYEDLYATPYGIKLAKEMGLTEKKIRNRFW